MRPDMEQRVPRGVRFFIVVLLSSVALAGAAQTEEPVQKTPPSTASEKIGANNGRMSPAQILDENQGAVAVIVAAGDTSTKLGTGFFLRPSGLLLTNFHVVEGTDLVGVKLPMRSDILWARNARGFDPHNDLVVLEVEGSGVKVVKLGNSDQVRVGEPIVVVGNPEGLEQTVSNGLISGVRELDGRKLFQISAPISEGSSGGPVFNENGEVIGVVVATLESGQNLNFAVPINYAKALLQISNEVERMFPAGVPIGALPKRGPAGNSPPEMQKTPPGTNAILSTTVASRAGP